MARRLFEAVAEDERLRGDLTDEGYAPLLEWCARRAAQLASANPAPRPSPARGEGPGGGWPAADFESLAAALRATLAAIVRAAERGDAADLAEISAEIVDPSTLPDLRRALAAAPANPDGRARSMAALLTRRTP